MTSRPTFKHYLLITTLLLLLSQAALAEEFSGKVVAVKDGDTIEVMHEGRAVRIRLAEIDTPEKRQPWGKRAKQFTSGLTYKKVVTVRPVTTDCYRRTVAHVILPDGASLSRELVKAGMAWHYKRYSKSAELAALENEARAAKRGLWAEPNPVPPWEWRRQRR